VKIQGQHSYSVSRDLVWRALMDPRILARTLPGCDALVSEDERRFRGGLSIKVGPIQGRFAGTVELSDVQPPESFAIHVHGDGPHGFMDGRGIVRLEGGADWTTVSYSVDAAIGGRIASVGQRLLDSTARAVTRQALEGLGLQLEALASSLADPHAAPPATPLRPASPDQRSQVRFAVGVAREVAADLVPARRRPILTAAAVAATAVAAWLCWLWIG
jgi:carbon monoxide dehydrogenase subunit G